MDRLHSNDLALTQDLIANMLGARREGITEAAGRLQDAGLIKHRRGHIGITDRIGLESPTCECYTVVKREYARLAYAPIDRKPGKPNSIKFETSSVLCGASMSLEA